jgi:hypothetical protein
MQQPASRSASDLEVQRCGEHLVSFSVIRIIWVVKVIKVIRIILLGY